MNRKFFRWSIEQLEVLSQQQRANISVLEELEEELSHRNTQRARRLRSSVNQRLRTLRPEKVKPPHEKIPFDPDTDSQKETRRELFGKSHDERREPYSDAFRASSLPPNQPEEILSAWTALEVLSPPRFTRPEDLAGGDRGRVAYLSEALLPWERGEKSRPNFRLYYQVVLGSIKLEPAIEALVTRFGDSREERHRARGRAVLATVTLDRRGSLVEKPAVGISSFGWGLTTALNGHLSLLDKWPAVERDLIDRIERQMLVSIGDDPNLPLPRKTIIATFQAIMDEFRLPNEWLEPPGFAIRSFMYYRDQSPPEPLVLNSFYLDDITLARDLFRSGRAPGNLKRYLGVEKTQRRHDLLRQPEMLERAIRPALTPVARWPGPDHFHLVLLQQAAVNLAFGETAQAGIIGINGPPGTGKTTLLRDLVAGVVCERAANMAKFDDPELAFESSGERLKAGDSWINLYRLNAALRGFEMIVASANNRAVENVSAELPGLNAISADVQLRYLKTLSDSLHQRETWGAIAAVLGNLQNRARFKQLFWWDTENAFSSYLANAAGMRTSDIPRIVELEQPPKTREEALQRWKNARQRFSDSIERSRKWQAWLEYIRNLTQRLPKLKQAELNAAMRLNEAQNKADNIQNQLRAAIERESFAAAEQHDTEAEVDANEALKPPFWTRIFRLTVARNWSRIRSALRSKHLGAVKAHEQAIRIRQKLEKQLTIAESEYDEHRKSWETAVAEYQEAAAKITEAKTNYGVLIADDLFFRLKHEKQHQSTPWFPLEAQLVREEVFISAMDLHRAFIDAAARPLRHNLSALMRVFTKQTLPTADTQALLGDLWSSLFLVVPLVSTTFASVNRMLGKLPLQSLGWLFVDEGGQALPQSIIGGLLRTRRVVVVGDPLQLEPVVELPDRLTSAVCRQFGVEPDVYSAPRASAQTLSDAASSYQCEFQTREGGRTVGTPLLVHRRCSEPMFRIANEIAYGQLMVSAKQPNSSTVRGILGPSGWFHVDGSGEDKWCYEEGQLVVHLLQQLASAKCEADIFVITPFVIVADRLRGLIRDSGVLRGWVEQDEWQWTSQRVGTVHTVQGREAEAVIFVLGAPYPAQTGARNWAGWPPNLLNVAITRAKEVFYVIGNRRLWSEAGVFRSLDRTMPRDY